MRQSSPSFRDPQGASTQEVNQVKPKGEQSGDVEKSELEEDWAREMENLIVKAKGWREELAALGVQWKIDYPHGG